MSTRLVNSEPKVKKRKTSTDKRVRFSYVETKYYERTVGLVTTCTGVKLGACYEPFETIKTYFGSHDPHTCVDCIMKKQKEGGEKCESAKDGRINQSGSTDGNRILVETQDSYSSSLNDNSLNDSGISIEHNSLTDSTLMSSDIGDTNTKGVMTNESISINANLNNNNSTQISNKKLDNFSNIHGQTDNHAPWYNAKDRATILLESGISLECIKSFITEQLNFMFELFYGKLNDYNRANGLPLHKPHRTSMKKNIKILSDRGYPIKKIVRTSQAEYKRLKKLRLKKSEKLPQKN